MQRNKGLLLTLIIYIISLIYFLIFLFQFVYHIVLNRPADLPFQFIPDGLLIILCALLIIALLGVIYGIFNTKRWGYKLGIILTVLSLPSFIGIFLSESKDFTAILYVINGIILFINRKAFK